MLRKRGGLETCAADGYTWTAQACEFGCDETGGLAVCAPCVDVCAQGEARCASDGVEVCAVGALGCFEWQLDTIQKCRSSGEFCDDSSGVAQCTGTPPEPTPGHLCQDPAQAPIQIPSAIATGPLVMNALTTCGAGNYYSETCLDVCANGLGDCDNGNDLLFELAVAEATSVVITLDAKGASYSGIAVDDVCPPDATCTATSVGPDGGPHSTPCTLLEPGLHFFMIDIWPAPYCIPDFDLTITDCS